jgi:transposase-like protein
MKKEFITYSEAFKMQVVNEIKQGKFASILQAQKTYGIYGTATIQKWINNLALKCEVVV